MVNVTYRTDALFPSRLSPRDLITFAQDVAVLLESGISLARGLHILFICAISLAELAFILATMAAPAKDNNPVHSATSKFGSI